MPNFTEIIRYKGEKHYFSFTKKETQAGLKYSVETSKLNTRISFEMELVKGKWKILSYVPEWIKRVKEQLHEAIETRQNLNI